MDVSVFGFFPDGSSSTMDFQHLRDPEMHLKMGNYFSDVELAVFSKFHKISTLTTDMALVAKALSTSTLLEVMFLTRLVFSRFFLHTPLETRLTNVQSACQRPVKM